MSDAEKPPASDEPKKPKPEISDAELLFEDAGPTSKLIKQSVHIPATESAGTFDLAEPIEPRPAPTRPVPDPPKSPAPTQAPPMEPVRGVTAPPPVPPTSFAKDRPFASERDREFRQASSSAFEVGESVDQIWTRRAEWGLSLVALGSWTIILLSMLYILLSAEFFSLAFMVLILGGVYWLYLCYPILITLEIPVRLTPESAVKDYYAALSHHMPHYRRMWLLLSRQAKLTTYFGSFEGFRNYWKARLKELKQVGEAEAWTPLIFQVESFVSEKSVDKTLVHAQYVVKVFVRGRRGEGPIATIPMRVDLVRGPDKMLYLGNGTLPAQGSD